MIRPDAKKKNVTGKIVDRLESAGLRVVVSKRVMMSKAEAQAFYAVHKKRPFYGGLPAFMSSGTDVRPLKFCAASAMTTSPCVRPNA